MHECFPKHLRMGTARMEEHKDRIRRQAEKSENEKLLSGQDKN